MSAQSLRSTAARPPLLPHAPKANGDAEGTQASCVICRRATATSFRVHGYRLFICAQCNYVFVDPAAIAGLSGRAIFDDAYFYGGGAGYANYLDEAQMLRAHGARYGRMLRAAGAMRVLDVGAAAGFILAGMLDAGCQGVGIEPNATMAGYAARELRLDVREATLEAFETGERFDAVTLLQVVDHLEDIRLCFARVAALTKPGGRCLVEFGNRASLTARILGASWHEYAPPSVQRVFSLRALRLVFAQYGFVLEAWGHPPKYLRADHAFSLLQYKAGAPISRMLLKRLAGTVPAGAKLRYPGDDVNWARFVKR